MFLVTQHQAKCLPHRCSQLLSSCAVEPWTRTGSWESLVQWLPNAHLRMCAVSRPEVCLETDSIGRSLETKWIHGGRGLGYRLDGECPLMGTGFICGLQNACTVSGQSDSSENSRFRVPGLPTLF